MWSKNSASLTQLILDPGSWIRICVSLLPGSGSISKLVSGSGPVKYFFRPCFTGDNYSFYHRRRLEREDKAKVEFILFFQIDRGKTASAARNLINPPPPSNRGDDLCLCFCLHRSFFYCICSFYLLQLHHCPPHGLAQAALPLVLPTQQTVLRDLQTHFSSPLLSIKKMWVAPSIRLL